MKTKVYRATMQFKEDGEPGEFEAVFATLNVVDLDDDVTVPGAFGEQKVLIEPWNHDYSSPPVGRGRIFERGNDAVVEGKFFLDTQAGQEHYLVAKELKDMQEFSYTFYIEEADHGQFEGQDVRFLRKLDVVGVGQVSRGAGVGTRLTAIKRGKDNGEGTSEPGESESQQPDEDEGEIDTDKPSVVGTDVIRAQIDILDLEE